MNLGPAGLIVVAALIYAFAVRSTRNRQRLALWRAGACLGGLGVLGLALAGPLDALAHTLFWAHMVQHMLLTVVVPPLLALGQPIHIVLTALSPARRRRIAMWIFRPAWARGLLDLAAQPMMLALTLNVPLVVWHLPFIYEAALANQLLHDLEHVSFMGPAVTLWLLLLEPTIPRRCRLSAEGALLVLFATWMVCDLLGALLALSGAAWYPAYAVSSQTWGISAVEDQRLGGLVMWITGGVFYACAMLVTFIRLSGIRGAGAQVPTGR